MDDRHEIKNRKTEKGTIRESVGFRDCVLLRSFQDSF